jgi:hypothetical protein
VRATSHLGPCGDTGIHGRRSRRAAGVDRPACSARVFDPYKYPSGSSRAFVVGVQMVSVATPSVAVVIELACWHGR